MKQRIIFPTNEQEGLLSKRGAHFGRANYYTLVEVDEGGVINDVVIVKNRGHENGGCTSAVDNICALQADALVVSGIGGSPLKGFNERGLDVYYDNASSNVHESLFAYLNKKLVRMQPEMSCRHH